MHAGRIHSLSRIMTAVEREYLTPANNAGRARLIVETCQS